MTITITGDLLNGWPEDGQPMMLDDTGERRRLIDAVSEDEALELLASMAMETALRRGNPHVSRVVEKAIMRLRLKLLSEELGD